MAVAVTSDQFLALVRKSKLIPSARLDAFLGDGGPLPSTCYELAQALVEAGLVTQFQADQLLKGRYKGFDLGRYRVLEPIGGGAMGMVYLCEHSQMKHRVAIKLLSKTVAQKDKTALARFQREARAAAKLSHPNIVRTHDIDIANGYHYLVMEYVQGTTLYDLVTKEGPLPADQVAHFAIQAAVGLQHIHEASLVHRDIKPGNLLLDGEGTVKILDLGLALITDEHWDNLTEASGSASILGTASFLSPEQAARSHHVDIRADVYSLGATAYFLLSGEAPFSNLPLTHKLVALHMSKPKALLEYRPDLDPALVEVVDKMMAKDAAERYQTPLEAAHALAAFLPVPVELPPLRADGEPMSSTSSNQSVLDTKKVRTSSRTQPGSSFTGVALKPLTGHGSSSIRIAGPTATPKTEPEPEPAAASVSGPAALSTAVAALLAHRETAVRWLREHPRVTIGSVSGVVVLLFLTVFVLPRFSAPKAVAESELRRSVAPVIVTVPSSPPVVSTPPVAPASPLIAPPPAADGIVRVNRSGAPGTFRTLRDALANAKPGSTVQVTDATHQEELTLAGSLGQGVTVRAAGPGGRPVVWKLAPGQAKDKPLLTVTGVAGFRLEGPFVLDGEDNLNDLIALQGSCPGVCLQGVTLQNYAQKAVVLRGCQGTAGKSVRLEELRVIASEKAKDPAGVCFLRPSQVQDGDNQNVIVQDCRFEGKLAGAVRLAGEALNVVVRGNRFFKNDEAIRFDRAEPPLRLRLEVANNTFYENAKGISYAGYPLKDFDNSFALRQNLFVGTASLAHAEGEPPAAPAVPVEPVKAKWVWTERTVTKPGERFFRKAFYLPTANFTQARLDIACADGFAVWLNGKQVGQGDLTSRRVYALDLVKQLQAGKNVLAVQASTKGQAAGLLAQLTCKSSDGASLVVAASDDTWRCHTDKASDWLSAGFGDSSWADAKVVADFGKFQGELAWDSAKQGGTAAVRHLVPHTQDNFCDATSKEGRLQLGSRTTAVPELSTDPEKDSSFLRYDTGDGLAKLGYNGTPVGAPPEEQRFSVADRSAPKPDDSPFPKPAAPSDEPPFPQPAAPRYEQRPGVAPKSAPEPTAAPAYRLDLTKQQPFGVRLRGASVLQRLGMGDWPAGWDGLVWRPDSVGELNLESINGVMALAIRNYQGHPAAEFRTKHDQPLLHLRQGRRYAIRVEYLTKHHDTRGRVDLRFGNLAAPGRHQAEMRSTGGQWQTARLIVEPVSDAPLVLYIANLTTGPDKALYVRAIEVADIGEAGAAPVAGPPVYRLDLRTHPATSVRMQGGEELERGGELPASWTAMTWHQDSVSKFTVESVRGAMALGIRNLEGQPSSMLFLNDLPLRAGRNYTLRFQYIVRGATGFLKMAEEGRQAVELGTLQATGDDWQTAEYQVSVGRSGKTRFEFFNNANSPNVALFLKDVEVLDLGR